MTTRSELKKPLRQRRVGLQKFWDEHLSVYGQTDDLLTVGANPGLAGQEWFALPRLVRLELMTFWFATKVID